MKKRKNLVMFLSLCMILVLASCGKQTSGVNTGTDESGTSESSGASDSSSAAAKVTELKWGSVHTEDSITTQMMMRAIDEINANAEGIHITGFPNSQLGNSSDLAEGIQEGLVDIITESSAQFGTWIPKANQIEAPYMWKSVEHMQNALNGEYKEVLNDLFDDINVKIMGTFYYGTRQLTTKQPVNTLTDLKGMKIRVPQIDMYVKMVESWGAAPTPMALNELYMSLSTGTVDAQENPLPTYEAQAFYEVAPYIIMTNHIICPTMIFINGDVWDSLSDHDKEVVQNAIDSAIAWQNEETIAAEKTLAETLVEEYGCTIIEPDDTIREATIPYIQPLVEDWDLIQSFS